MKDSHGVSRGTCFALCEDRNSLERALKLDGPKFDDKIIRISLADKRDKK